MIENYSDVNRKRNISEPVREGGGMLMVLLPSFGQTLHHAFSLERNNYT